jgi:hypothetical protein
MLLGTRKDVTTKEDGRCCALSDPVGAGRDAAIIKLFTRRSQRWAAARVKTRKLRTACLKVHSTDVCRRLSMLTISQGWLETKFTSASLLR